MLKPDRSAILLFDEASGELTTRAVRPAGEYTSVSDFASSTAVREAIRAREVLEVCDARLDSRLQGSASIARAGVRSAICVPLLGRTGPIGALYADQVWYAGRFSKEQVQYTAAFAAHGGGARDGELYYDRERHFADAQGFARVRIARGSLHAGHSTRHDVHLCWRGPRDRHPARGDSARSACCTTSVRRVPDCALEPARSTRPSHDYEAHVVIGYDMLVPRPFLKDRCRHSRHHEVGRRVTRCWRARPPSHARLLPWPQLRRDDLFAALRATRCNREAARRLRAGAALRSRPPP